MQQLSSSSLCCKRLDTTAVCNSRVATSAYQLVLVPQHIKNVKSFTELQATLAANRHYRARIGRDIGGSSEGREYEIWIENVASGKVVSNIGTSVNPFRQ